MKCIKSPYFRAFMHFLFSHIGLCLLVSTYCVLGALLFLYFESDLEKQAVNASRVARCAAEGKRNELIEQIRVAYNNGDLHQDELRMWVDEFHKALTTNDTIKAYQHTTDKCADTPKYKWTMASAVLFTVTTVGCIGYGNIVPTTDISQFALICYCLIGIPLTLMFLANIGRLFASIVRIMFSHGVCYFCWKRRNRNQEAKTRFVAIGGGANAVPVIEVVEVIRVEPNHSESQDANGEGTTAKLNAAKEHEIEEKERERLQMVVPKAFIFSILGVYAFLGTLLFAWTEGWTYIQSAYFNVVTLMTIGLGDLVPGWSAYDTVMGTVKMVLGAVYIMLGLGVLFMGLNLIVDELMNASKKAGKKMGLVKDEKRKKARSNLERAVRRQVY